MAVIVIAYTTTTIDGQTVRIYNDNTEKYFEDPEDSSTKEYINYLGNRGYTLEVSTIKVYTPGEYDVEAIVKADALAKLTEQEKQALGLS